MAPVHAAGSTVESSAFAAIGLAQLIVAIVLVGQPSRAALKSAIVISGGTLMAWTWSRTFGLPVGAHPGSPESIALTDATCALFQAVAVGGAAFRLASPDRIKAPSVPLPFVGALSAGVLALATLAIASPSATSHGDHPHTDSGELATGIDGAVAPAVHDHAAATTDLTADAHSDDHAHDDMESAHPHDGGDSDTADHAHDGGTADHPHDGAADSAHAHAAAGTGTAHDHGSTGTAGANHAHPGTGTGTGNTDHQHDNTGTTPSDHAHDGTGTDTGDHGHHPTDPSAPVDPEHTHPTTPPVDLKNIAVDYGPANRCDLGFHPSAYFRDATLSKADFVNGPTAAEINAPHQMSEIAAARLVQGLADSTDLEYYQWLASADPHHAHAAVPRSVAGSPDHHNGPQAWKAMTDPAQCQLLADELGAARDAAMAHPTAKSAKQAGYSRVTPYVMGIGAHYVKGSIVDGVFDPRQPEMLLYDGNDDNAHIVGLSYEIYAEQESEPTVGFTGRNDRYHRHDRLCFRNGITIGDGSMTDEQCKALGGEISDGRYLWMSHAWIVPGCESPWGVFSQMNPLLDIQLGNASGSTSGCAASNGRTGNRWVFTPPRTPLPPRPYVPAGAAAVAVLPTRE